MIRAEPFLELILPADLQHLYRLSLILKTLLDEGLE